MGFGVLVILLRSPRSSVPEPGVILSDVTIVNPGAGRRWGCALRIEGDRIARIEGCQSGPTDSQNSGRFVLPGLIDLHVHHPPARLLGERDLFSLLFLAHGVTSVRDVGQVAGSLEEHRRRIQKGGTPGPGIYRCGRMLDGQPPSWPRVRVVEDAAGARAAVAQLAASGADCVKTYNGLSAEAFSAIRAAAVATGLPLVAHVPRRVSLAALGSVEVQHLMGLTRHWNDVDPGRIAWYVETSLEQSLVHTPTLVAFASAAAGAPLQEGALDLLPSYYAEILWNPERSPLAAGYLAAAGGGRIRVMQTLVRALHAADVPIRVGTDAGTPFVVPGVSLHDELRLLVEAGLQPEEAWEVATRRAGEMLGRESLGVVVEGAPADLLVFREDPTRDLAALDSLEAVVAQGREYTKERLARELSRWQAHFQSPGFRMLSRWLAIRAVSRAPASQEAIPENGNAPG